MVAVRQAPVGGVADGSLGERDGLRWWPSVLGAAVAVFSGLGVDNGAGLAMVVVASAFIYLAVAAQGSARSAWGWFALSIALITVGKIVGDEWAPVLVMVAVAVPLVVWGVTRGRWPLPGGLRRQTAAMSAFGAVAVVGLDLDSAVGGLLVAAGLVAHGGWDVVHHRRNRVVVRSFAELCVVLDLVLAGIIVWAVLT